MAWNGYSRGISNSLHVWKKAVCARFSSELYIFVKSHLPWVVSNQTREWSASNSYWCEDVLVENELNVTHRLRNIKNTYECNKNISRSMWPCLAHYFYRDVECTTRQKYKSEMCVAVSKMGCYMILKILPTAVHFPKLHVVTICKLGYNLQML